MRLKRGDKVYVYGDNDIIRYVLLLKHVQIYYEVTENPEVVMHSSKLFKPTLADHINFCKKVTCLIVISESLKAYYINKGVSEEKIHIVNMMVDPHRFDGLTKHKNTRKHIAYCGSVSIYKDGVDDLIRAFCLIKDKHQDTDLLIMGSYYSLEDKTAICNLIASEGIGNRVILAGKVASDEMPQMLINAQVLALARPDNTQAKYGFPTKLGEYLMTGNPVVITDVGDVSLFLKDGENALIAPANSPKLFAEKLDWALYHPEGGNAIGLKGKEVALRFFNALNETRKLFNILNSSLSLS